MPRVAGAEVAQQPHQAEQLLPAGIGHGAILKIADLPEGNVIAAAGGEVRERASAGHPGEYVDDVLSLIHI